MVDKLLLRATRAGDNYHLWVPHSVPTFVLDRKRIAIEDSKEEIERTIRRTEVVNDRSFLPIIPIEPTQTVVRHPHTAHFIGLLESNLRLPTTSRTSKPHDIRLHLQLIYALLRKERLEPLVELHKNSRKLSSEL